MEFITSGDRIAVENFSIGKIYTITWLTGTYKNLACVGTGSDFVMFQDQSPELLFCLTMESAQSVSSIEEGSSGGTTNYNELTNKPSINGFVLVGNKTGADLGLVSQSDLDNYVTDSELATELEDYATNASVVAALASKQDALNSSQLAAVNSGLTSTDVTQIRKYVTEETGFIRLKDLTWTQSGSGLYYSNTINLSTVKTILSYQPMSFNGLGAVMPPVIFQNATNAANQRFALVSTTGSFGDSAELSYRIYGTTD